MQSRSRARTSTANKKAHPKTWVVTPDRFLRPEQVTILRAALEIESRSGAPKKVRDAVIVELLLGSGLRVSETCSLKVGDLHVEGEQPALFVRRGKGGRPRLVPISSRLTSLLRMFLEQKREWGEPVDASAPVFLGQHGVALTRFGLSKIWGTLLRVSGLPHRGIHASRHSYAVEVYRKTKDLRLTQRLLGHASVVTTTTYASLLDEDARAGVEKVWA